MLSAVKGHYRQFRVTSQVTPDGFCWILPMETGIAYRIQYQVAGCYRARNPPATL